MEENAKNLWLETLSKNKYLKGDTYLRIDKKDKTYWSLMGIFCDIFKSKLNAKWIKNPFTNQLQYYYILGDITNIPKILSDKVKVKPFETKIIIECQRLYKNVSTFNEEINYLKNKL